MKVFSIFLVVLMYSKVALGKDCPEISGRLSQEIEKYALSIKGTEYCRFRSVVKSKNIEAVLFSVEGACFDDDMPVGTCGNVHFRYVVAIKNETIIRPFQVGRRGGFSASEIELVDSIIKLRGKLYGDSDPMCCPSLEEVKYLSLKENTFIWKNP